MVGPEMLVRYSWYTYGHDDLINTPYLDSIKCVELSAPALPVVWLSPRKHGQGKWHDFAGLPPRRGRHCCGRQGAGPWQDAHQERGLALHSSQLPHQFLLLVIAALVPPCCDICVIKCSFRHCDYRLLVIMMGPCECYIILLFDINCHTELS